MTAQDTVNRVLREFKRYTGDGLPSEPTGAPLPVGDPQSGVLNPKKADLREALLATLTGAELQIGFSEEWAQSDDPISVDAGGNGTTDRSSKWWAQNAETTVTDATDAVVVAATEQADRAEDEADRAQTVADALGFAVVMYGTTTQLEAATIADDVFSVLVGGLSYLRVTPSTPGLGDELNPDPGFNTPGDWAYNPAVWLFDDDEARSLGGEGALSRTDVLTGGGSTYIASIDVLGYASGELYLALGQTSFSPPITSSNWYRVITPTGDPIIALAQFPGTEYVGTVDNLSVRELPDTAVQSVDGAWWIPAIYGDASPITDERIASPATPAQGINPTKIASGVRSLNDWRQDVINVRDEGMIGDSVGDGLIFDNILNMALSQNRPIYAPPGNYLLDRRYSKSWGRSVRMFGEGPLSKLIFTGTDGGLNFTLTPQGSNRPPDQAHLDDLWIESRAAVAHPLVNLEWSAYQPNAQGQGTLERLTITRANDGTGSFPVGLRMKNAIIVDTRNVKIIGDDARVSATGIQLIDVVETRFYATQVNRCQTGMFASVDGATQNEGIICLDCIFYDVFNGMDIRDTLGFNLLDSHVNINGASADTSIYLRRIAGQSQISGCNVYFGGLAADPTNQDAMVLEDSSGVLVKDGWIVNVQEDDNTGVGIAIVGASGENRIMGMELGIGALGFGILNNSGNSNAAVGNKFYGAIPTGSTFVGAFGASMMRRNNWLGLTWLD